MKAKPSTIERTEKEIQQRRFEFMARAFFKRWQPNDPYEAAEFNTELFCLVRQIYVDAQQPVLDQLGVLAQAIPLSKIVKP